MDTTARPAAKSATDDPEDDAIEQRTAQARASVQRIAAEAFFMHRSGNQREAIKRIRLALDALETAGLRKGVLFDSIVGLRAQVIAALRDCEPMHSAAVDPGRQAQGSDADRAPSTCAIGLV